MSKLFSESGNNLTFPDAIQHLIRSSTTDPDMTDYSAILRALGLEQLSTLETPSTTYTVDVDHEDLLILRQLAELHVSAAQDIEKDSLDILLFLLAKMILALVSDTQTLTLRILKPNQ